MWPKVKGVSFRKSNAVICFNIVPSYINTIRPAVMEQTDPLCVEGAIWGPQKVVHNIYSIFICGQMITTELLFWGRGSSQRELNQENRVGLRQDGIHISG